ncbi:MAG TPA: hypothetical protein DCE41_06735 [Cytophagales bacterium]|nr:hypothetical protein [Cytophagales bacterium]HAA19958.1 hypothetical protein [Cytophagales bacterium]HAP58350.1 hypothetical protein [Cytophagales bacterium]
MSTSFTHIFNGDSTAEAYAHSGLEGQEFVWREMVVQGPSKGIPGQESFFGPRRTYFQKELGMSAESYYSLTEEEWHRMAGASRRGEWVLWYEYDVFCQFNLIALLAGIHYWDNPPDRLSLICVGEDENHRWNTLANFSPDQYPKLLDTRKGLTHDDLLYAATVWEAFIQKAPLGLLPFAQTPHPSFPYLGLAIGYYLRQFPQAHNGLNTLEDILLQEIAQSPKTQPQLIRQVLLQRNHPFGFGDLQWMWYMKKLQPLWLQEDDHLSLTNLGKKVLEGDTVYREHLAGRHFGGATALDYIWEEDREEIRPFPEK